MRQVGILISSALMAVVALVLTQKNGDAASIALAASLVLIVMWAWLNGWFESEAGTYRVEGTDTQGDKTIEFEASDSANARARAEAMGLRVVSISRVAK